MIKFKIGDLVIHQNREDIWIVKKISNDRIISRHKDRKNLTYNAPIRNWSHFQEINVIADAFKI